MNDMTSLFELYSEAFASINVSTGLSEPNQELLKLRKREMDKVLSSNAAKASATRGRLIEEHDNDIRNPYERDTGRIIFSQSFRRLKHKTQVFFNPTNDHICSRLEHVLYVYYISSTIGKALGLNTDLIQAIALGHDIGHAPFGHSGERFLNRCLKAKDPDRFFEHEAHGLRVIDVLESRNGETGLNLTFEVRDGILSHCGEIYDEKVLRPYRDKPESEVSFLIPKAQRKAPATMEGCVVRFADKIAYVGRDIEDALRTGIIEDLSVFEPEAVAVLGHNNSQVINTLVEDIINSSIGKDEIRMSDTASEALQVFLNTNVEQIYRAHKVNVYEKTVGIMIEGLFDAFYNAAVNLDVAADSSKDAIRKFTSFVSNHPEPDCPAAVKVTDYIAGMTDQFATDCFNELYKN
ncbi:dGTPase [Ruminococcaceae bacterium YRB3002]|nr:dGTPase [Ruminococcaceae bacterium YRB3002]